MKKLLYKITSCLRPSLVGQCNDKYNFEYIFRTFTRSSHFSKDPRKIIENEKITSINTLYLTIIII